MHINTNVVPFKRVTRPVNKGTGVGDLSAWYDSLFNTLTTAGTQIYETSQAIKAQQAAAQTAQAQAANAQAQANLVRTVAATSPSAGFMGLSTTTWLVIAGVGAVALIGIPMMRHRRR